MNFQQFRNSSKRNAWIKEPGIKIYVRMSILKGRGNYELANMNATKPGKGALTRFLDCEEPTNQFFIENILNERLIDYFTKRGYTKIPNTNPVCMIGPGKSLDNHR